MLVVPDLLFGKEFASATGSILYSGVGRLHNVSLPLGGFSRMSIVHFGGSYGAIFPGIGIVEKAEVWDDELMAAAAQKVTKRC